MPHTLSGREIKEMIIAAPIFL